jgi:hypothetical protein
MSKPILYVDDDTPTGTPRLEATGLPFREKGYRDVADDSSISDVLQDTKIVLMDYCLHDDNASFSAPLDGLELLERFRARIRRHYDQGASVPLLTIYTSQIDRLAEHHGECPVVPYMLARRAKVDWIFAKQCPANTEDPFGDQLQDMLDAFSLEMDGGGSVEEQLATFLRLPEASECSDLALEELLDTRPPVQEDLSLPGARVRLIGWLLQVVLPFPGCFVDLSSVAVRLRVSPADLASALERRPDSDVATLLDKARYHGPLACFFPTRYWKAGVDYMLWEITEGRSPGNPAVRSAISDAIGEDLPSLDVTVPSSSFPRRPSSAPEMSYPSTTRSRFKPTFGPYCRASLGANC